MRGRPRHTDSPLMDIRTSSVGLPDVEPRATTVYCRFLSSLSVSPKHMPGVSMPMDVPMIPSRLPSIAPALPRAGFSSLVLQQGGHECEWCLLCVCVALGCCGTLMHVWRPLYISAPFVPASDACGASNAESQLGQTGLHTWHQYQRLHDPWCHQTVSRHRSECVSHSLTDCR